LEEGHPGVLDPNLVQFNPVILEKNKKKVHWAFGSDELKT
jgi:hypothetical protein